MSGGGHGGGSKRRVHEEEHEEHENHERWLVSYADMMTLLMVLFIVMFAISAVDEKKFFAVKAGLAAGFGAPITMLSGDHLLDPGGAIAPDTINLTGQDGGAQAARGAEPTTVDPEAVAQLAKVTERAQVAKEVENLKRTEAELKKALEKSGQKNGATFRFDERGLIVTIATDKVLFASGEADLLPGGRRILDTIGPTLRALPNRLSIDGHTNSLPISTARFPSNWELSTARATGVLRYLSRSEEIPGSRMYATGFADTRPLVTGDGPRALVANRRVEIVVLARVDNSAGRAVAELGSAPDQTAQDGTAQDQTAQDQTTQDGTAQESAATADGTGAAQPDSGGAAATGPDAGHQQD